MLPKCPYFGPTSDDSESIEAFELPADYDTDPFRYVPEAITLSDAELKLADQYENEDFSGGYLASQIAHFRRPRPKQKHESRRAKFRDLRKNVEREGLVFPSAFVELVESDDYHDRLRHNTIWLTLPDEIVPLPADPSRKLFLIAYECQGCDYWHLLLAPDGTHAIAYCAEPLGRRNMYPGGFKLDPATVDVYQCADSFCEWIVAYFVDCERGDRHYEEMLERYPGM